jgi:hypothetical protein
MPDKPLWLGNLPTALGALESSPETWIDRSTLQSLLGVGRRRAQQLLKPVTAHRIGTSAFAHRSALIAHLRKIAAGEEAYYEQKRLARFATRLAQARQEWIQHPPVLVEISQLATRRVELLDFDGLPEGVGLAPGSITVHFANPDEALRKLMALAMAIGKNRDAFDELVSIRKT